MTINNYISYPSIPPTNFPEQVFRTSTTGTSDCNNFIPFFAVFTHVLIQIKESGVNILEYNMPVASTAGGQTRNFTNFKQYICNTSYPIKFTYSIAGVQHEVYVYKGIVFTGQGEVLMCVGINTEYLMITPYAELRTLDVTKYVLFVSTKLLEDQYKSLRKRLERDYISVFTEAGIDIITTSRVGDWLFKNNFEKPKFKTIKESTQHLKEVQGLLLKM